MLPVLLFSSLLIGACCMLVVQRQCVENIFGRPSGIAFAAFFSSLFILTLGSMSYAALSDPGQVPDDIDTWPERSHKSFQYDRPLLRYDHFCRWITNCVALRTIENFLSC